MAGKVEIKRMEIRTQLESEGLRIVAMMLVKDNVTSRGFGKCCHPHLYED